MRSWQKHVAVFSCMAMSSVACPAWAQLQWVDRAVPGPSPRCEFGFAYDSARGVSVLFGGSSNLSFSAVNSETWEWNGTEWALRATTGPVARCDHAFAYDSARQRVVCFGGYNGAYLDDTWEWDGTSWAQKMVPGPSRRADSFMAFDPDRNVMVLFGGQQFNGTILNDTWEYDGVTWTQRATGGPTRWIQRMAYDRIHKVIVMYGGASPSEVLSDTWEWQGASWIQRPVTGPPARYGNAMCYDVARGRSVLFGGQSDFGFGINPLGDTWEFDGAQWIQIAIPGPSVRTFVKMVYDEARHRAVLFGGYAGGALGDTWELFDPTPPPVGVAPGKPAGMSLAGFRPNPPRGELRVAFSLARAESTRLEVLDVSGRRLVRRDLGVLGSGHHVVGLGTRTKLPPGVYVLRLSQGSESTTTRGVISK